MKMRVLMPFPKPGNTFFEEVMLHSKCDYVFGDLNTDIVDFDIVLIHWPELIFKWAEPNTIQLNILESKLIEWKKSVKIVYVVHNEKVHFGITPQFIKLYELILSNADTMVHLGNYSLDKFKTQYPNKEHKYIPHPLYKTSFEVMDKMMVRKELGLSSSKKIILVPGRIRTLKERKLVVSAFKKLDINNKYLIVPYMFKKRIPFSFIGSYRLQRIKIIKVIIDYICNFELMSSYSFGYKNMNRKQLALLISAADILFIPRINSLNSGLLFLGLTFNKIVVGPSIGNINEFLTLFSFPKYSPNNMASVTKALSKGFALCKNNDIDKNALKLLQPKIIAQKWDELFRNL